MKWEYKTFTVDDFVSSDTNLTIEEQLNKYGENGWELMGALPKVHATVGNPSRLYTDMIVFKKPSTI